MARTSKKAALAAAALVLEAAAKSAVEVKTETALPRILEDKREQAAIAEIEQQIALPHSVVKPTYKVKYKARAMAAGLKGKAAKRSNGDWLSRRMAELVLTEREKLNVQALVDLCAANGLEDIESRWPNRNTGWEGRLRMTACLVLRKIVADKGTLTLMDGSEMEAPAEFCKLNATR
jgi:hypothetical protein